MMEFPNMAQKAAKEKIRIGLAENEEYRCVVTRTPGGIIIDWQTAKRPFELPDHLIGASKGKNFAIFHSVPHQFIWREPFTIPLEYDDEEVLNHVHFVLNERLPTAIGEVYYDYKVDKFPEQDLQEVTVFAIRKEYAEKRHSQYHGVLDNELNCFWRGFQVLGYHFLNSDYKDEVYRVGNIIFHGKNNKAELLDAVPEGEKCLDVTQLNIDAHIPDKALYLAALGATLWEE